MFIFNKKIKYVLIILAIIFSFYNLSFAQDGLYIDQYPKQLKEDEEVYLTLKGEGYNLESSKITWKVDGKINDEGVGRVTFKNKAPKQNKDKRVIATVERAEGNSVFVEIILRPSPYTFLYEGKDSYTPPFYKGRAMPSKEGQVRLGIISFGEKNIVNWRINNTSLKDKNTVTILNSNITDSKLKIEADIYENDNLKATLSKDINLKKPEIILYATDKNNNSQRVAEGNEKGQDLYIKVEPFFYTAKFKKDDNLRFAWSLNGIKQDVKNPWLVKFNSSSKNQVQAKVEIRQIEKITQRGEKIVNINFE